MTALPDLQSRFCSRKLRWGSSVRQAQGGRGGLTSWEPQEYSQHRAGSVLTPPSTAVNDHSPASAGQHRIGSGKAQMFPAAARAADAEFPQTRRSLD